MHRFASVTFAVLLGGCLSSPFDPVCTDPQPRCFERCTFPNDDCVGEAYEPTCIDEDGDVHWYCGDGPTGSFGTAESTCTAFVSICAPGMRDSGMLPGTDGG